MPLTGPPGVLLRALREDVLRHASSANRVAMILSDPAATSDVAAFCRDHPDVRVTAFWPQEAEPLLDQPENLTCRWTHDLTDVHCLLAGVGPVDLLFESPGTPDDRLMIGYLFWHVRPGGQYVLDSHTRSWRQGWTRTDDPDGGVASLVPHLLNDTLGRGPFSEDVRSMVSSIHSATIEGDAVWLVRRGEAVIKVRHTQLARIIAARPNDEWCRIVGRKPAGELDAAAVIGVHNNRPLRDQLYPARIKAPQLVVREYQAVTAHPYGVLQRDDFILPDSFRLWRSVRLHHRRLSDLGQYFAEPPVETEPAHTLPGQYYHLGLEHQSHFGHFMTEGLARLWGWPAAKKRNPDLKLFLGALRPFQAPLLSALGIHDEDIAVERSSVVVESLISAMPAFCISRYVSEAIRPTYRRLRQGIERVESPGGELVFLSRTPGLWRECVNGSELEDYFVSRGFSVHQPELYTLAEQAALFREARVVAGYAGSQFCGQLFSAKPLQLICFTNTSFRSTNEFMMAAVLGHTLHQFWCEERPGRDQDIQGRLISGQHQDYAFNFKQDFPVLRRLVDRLVGRRRWGLPRLLGS